MAMTSARMKQSDWFPELEEATTDTPVPIVHAGDSVLVGYGQLRFWLHDVEVSADPGVYFGNITEWLPENDAYLNENQNIGFELRHVMDVRSGTTELVRSRS